jgi:NitT/TauT family transport system substrate-binding protein
VKKAMRWVASRSPEEVRTTIPEERRMPDAEADLEAIRQLQRTLSPDGMVAPAEAEAILKFVAVSDERVRNAHLDVLKTYTNEFTVAK